MRRVRVSTEITNIGVRPRRRGRTALHWRARHERCPSGTRVKGFPAIVPAAWTDPYNRIRACARRAGILEHRNGECRGAGRVENLGDRKLGDGNTRRYLPLSKSCLAGPVLAYDMQAADPEVCLHHDGDHLASQAARSAWPRRGPGDRYAWMAKSGPDGNGQPESSPKSRRNLHG